MTMISGGIVMIEGDIRQQLDEVFRPFWYQPLRSYEVAGWEAMLDQIGEWISEDVVRKAVLFANGWTVILDPEMVMADDYKTCPAIARTLGRRIVGVALLEDAAGFFLYDPEVRRAFTTSRGKTDKNEGEPLPVEAEMNLDRIGERDILRFLKSFGLDYEGLKNLAPFQVWELGELPVGNDER